MTPNSAPASGTGRMERTGCRTRPAEKSISACRIAGIRASRRSRSCTRDSSRVSIGRAGEGRGKRKGGRGGEGVGGERGGGGGGGGEKGEGSEKRREKRENGGGSV